MNIAEKLATIYARTRFERYIGLSDVDPTSDETFEWLADVYCDALRHYNQKEKMLKDYIEAE